MSSQAAAWVAEYYKLLSSNPAGLKANYSADSRLSWNRNGLLVTAEGERPIGQFFSDVRFAGAKADTVVEKDSGNKIYVLVGGSSASYTFSQSFVLAKGAKGKLVIEMDLLLATGGDADAPAAPVAPIAPAKSTPASKSAPKSTPAPAKTPAPAAPAKTPAPAPAAAAPAAAPAKTPAAPAAAEPESPPRHTEARSQGGSWADDEEEEEVKAPAPVAPASTVKSGISFAERLRANAATTKPAEAPKAVRTVARAAPVTQKNEGRSRAGVDKLVAEHEKVSGAAGARKGGNNSGKREGGGKGGEGAPRERGPSMYVAKLPSSATQAELNRIFSQFGKVKAVHHMEDKRIAFVDMVDAKSITAAIDHSEKEGIKMGNTKIVVQKRLSRSEIQARDGKAE